MRKILLLLSLAALLALAAYFYPRQAQLTETPSGEEQAETTALPDKDPPLVEALQVSGRDATSLARIDGLLKEGSDPNALDVKGRPAIYWAIANGDAKAIDLLAQAGADLNKVDREMHWTPLMHAAYYAARDPKLTGIAELLIERGANPNTSAGGLSPLHVAVANGPDSAEGAALLKMLIARGAKPDAEAAGITPLMDAARAGKISLARVLVQGGADPGRRSPGGKTPAEIAQESNQPELAQALAQSAAARRGGTAPAKPVAEPAAPKAKAAAPAKKPQQKARKRSQ